MDYHPANTVQAARDRLPTSAILSTCHSGCRVVWIPPAFNQRRWCSPWRTPARRSLRGWSRYSPNRFSAAPNVCAPTTQVLASAWQSSKESSEHTAELSPDSSPRWLAPRHGATTHRRAIALERRSVGTTIRMYMTASVMVEGRQQLKAVGGDKATIWGDDCPWLQRPTYWRQRMDASPPG